MDVSTRTETVPVDAGSPVPAPAAPVPETTQAPRDAGPSPIWDRTAFDDFAGWMPKPRVERLLVLFRERASVAAASLPGMTETAAWEKESHDLIYSAGTLGFVRLAEACRVIQGLIRKGQQPSDSDRKGMLDALADSLATTDLAVAAL